MMDTESFVKTRRPYVGDTIRVVEPQFALRAGVQACIAYTTLIGEVLDERPMKSGDAKMMIRVLESSVPGTPPVGAHVTRLLSTLKKRSVTRAPWADESKRPAEPQPAGKPPKPQQDMFR